METYGMIVIGYGQFGRLYCPDCFEKGSRSEPYDTIYAAVREFVCSVCKESLAEKAEKKPTV